MKWFALIFSIYILGLVSLPCADGADHACSSQTEQSAPNAGSHHNNDDSCSPFCVCTCCNVIVTVNQYFLIPVPTRVILSQIIPYCEGHISRFNTAIWQPPKVRV